MKPWYQLSVLQIMTLTMMVAVFTAFNLTTCQHSTIEETKLGLTRVYEIERIQAGCPMIFYDVCRRVPSDGGKPETIILSRGLADVSIRAVLLDSLIAVTIIAIAVLYIEKLNWKSPLTLFRQ